MSDNQVIPSFGVAPIELEWTLVKFSNLFFKAVNDNWWGGIKLFFAIEITWILTRDPKPDPSVGKHKVYIAFFIWPFIILFYISMFLVRKAMDVLDRNGLARSSLIPTGQDNCKYPWRNETIEVYILQFKGPIFYFFIF